MTHITHAHDCARPMPCPVPLAHLLRMMDTPPDFTPPKSATRRPYPLNVEARPYPQRNGSEDQKLATQSKYMAAMSKEKWSCAQDIADALNISPQAVKQTMYRPHMTGLVIRKKVTRNKVMINVWRLK